MRFGLQLLFRQKKAVAGFIIIAALVLMAICAPILAPNDPAARVGRSHQPPTVSHYFGTTKMGRDVYSQFVWGARPSLAVGFATGLAITALGTVIGLIAAYFGGRLGAPPPLPTPPGAGVPHIPPL
ncbi:ABC transporter permease, partial [Mesorhizobium sp. GbtcB19]|uniref:ABC transporter permease n=1 Tax=Mesorhizobium sp. GbtcB19 TaxID=2824764 RepID=UPI0034D3E2FD